MSGVTREQFEDLGKNARNNFLFAMIFMVVLAVLAFLSVPQRPSLASISPEIFATLLVADVVGVLQLAIWMTQVVDPFNFNVVKKHMTRFVRLLIVARGSGLVGLLSSVLGLASWLVFGLLILSLVSLFFIMLYSLDYIFALTGKTSAQRNDKGG